jgi:predicted outer membrane repeat protein
VQCCPAMHTQPSVMLLANAVACACACYSLHIALSQCVFTNNSASKCGGALSAEINTQIELDSCEFTSNTVRTTYSSDETGGHYTDTHYLQL